MTIMLVFPLVCVQDTNSTASFCDPFVLLASTCADMPMASGCKPYNRLCGGGSEVEQCAEVRGAADCRGLKGAEAERCTNVGGRGVCAGLFGVKQCADVRGPGLQGVVGQRE